MKTLVPIDGSNTSIKAANKAIELAKKLDSEIMFIHVVYDLILPKYDVNYDMYFDKIINDSTQLFEKSLEKINKQGIKFNKEILTGVIDDKIIQLANEGNFDMIIMGRSGMSKVKRFFVGSVTQRVIANAPCPVLIVNE